MRGELRQRELQGAVAVAARAFERDVLERDPADGEVLEDGVLVALDHERPSPALHGLHAKVYRRRAGPRRAVDGDIHAHPARDLLDALERVLLEHVDHVVGAQGLGDLHPLGVARGARDDDEVCARLLGDDQVAEALLAGALDQHLGAVADAGFDQRPLHAVAHRGGESGQLRGHAVGHLVDDGVMGHVEVVAEASPQVRREVGRGVPVADRVGVVVPVGGLAVAVLTLVVPLALHAGQIVLQEHEVAFLDALALQELLPGLGDDANVLMAHDHRTGGQRLGVVADVTPADAGDLHLQESRVLVDLRDRELARLHLARPDLHHGQ